MDTLELIKIKIEIMKMAQGMACDNARPEDIIAIFNTLCKEIGV